MKTSEARSRIEKARQAGIIDQAEADRRHRNISEINSGYRYCSRISWGQQAKLRAIWATFDVEPEAATIH